MSMKAFQAWATGGFRITRDTPRAAAAAFFEKFPGKRKCSITEGTTDGGFFTVTYGRASLGQWPRIWKDVTPKGVAALPDTAE